MTEAFVLRFHQSPITPMINTGIPKEKHQFTMSTTAGWKLQMAILTIPMMMMITRDKVDFCFSVAFGLYSVYISCEIRVAGASAITAKEERSTPKNPAASNAMTGFGSRSSSMAGVIIMEPAFLYARIEKAATPMRAG